MMQQKKMNKDRHKESKKEKTPQPMGGIEKNNKLATFHMISSSTSHDFVYISKISLKEKTKRAPPMYIGSVKQYSKIKCYKYIDLATQAKQ